MSTCRLDAGVECAKLVAGLAAAGGTTFGFGEVLVQRDEGDEGEEDVQDRKEGMKMLG